MEKTPADYGMEEGDVKTFRTKHATQQHMVDSCKCGMLFDDNEEEYEEFKFKTRVPNPLNECLDHEYHDLFVFGVVCWLC